MEFVLRRLPALAGAVAFAIGVVNLVSALTPNVAWRGHLLLQVMPVRAVPLIHSVSVPASVALIVCAFYLRRRRRRAWAMAFALLAALGVFDLAKGLDVEEALVSWAGAALLWRGREQFCVRHDRPRGLGVLAAAIVLPFISVLLLVWLASDHADDGFVVNETIRLFAFTRGSLAFQDDLSWIPLAVAAV